MELKITTLLLLTGLAGGCTATLTPYGDVYTEALIPSPVIVESYPRTVFVSPAHRPGPRPMGPIASGRRHAAGPHPTGHHSHGGSSRPSGRPGRR